MLEAIVVGVAIAAITGTGAWLVRRARPEVKFLARVHDYGRPVPGFITWRVGVMVEIELHMLRSTPMKVTEIGLELDDGTRIALAKHSRLGKAIAQPDHAVASGYLDGVRKQVRESGSHVRGFYATATPDRVFRRMLPASWEGFPDVLPPDDLT